MKTRLLRRLRRRASWQYRVDFNGSTGISEIQVRVRPGKYIGTGEIWSWDNTRAPEIRLAELQKAYLEVLVKELRER